MRKCGNCKYRCFSSWDGMVECCIGYEIAVTEEDEIREAKDCGRYEKGTPYCLERDEYCPSATAGDYGPGNPWAAPGMSIHDFI